MFFGQIYPSATHLQISVATLLNFSKFYILFIPPTTKIVYQIPVNIMLDALFS